MPFFDPRLVDHKFIESWLFQRWFTYWLLNISEIFQKIKKNLVFVFLVILFEMKFLARPSQAWILDHSRLFNYCVPLPALKCHNVKRFYNKVSTWWELWLAETTCFIGKQYGLMTLSWLSNFFNGTLTNLTQLKHPQWMTQRKATQTSYLSAVNMAHGDHSWKQWRKNCTKITRFARFRQK